MSRFGGPEGAVSGAFRVWGRFQSGRTGGISQGGDCTRRGSRMLTEAVVHGASCGGVIGVERAPKILTLRLPGRYGHKASMGFQSGNDLLNVKSFGFESRAVQPEIDLPLSDVQGEPLTEDLRMALTERLVCLDSTVDL